MAKQRKLRDEQLLALLNTQIDNSVGYSDSKLAKEREKITRYYDGDDPKPLHHGNSKYVSQDVWDAVESAKAQLLEVFSGNRRPVQFTPTGAEDVEDARVATEYCTYVIFRQNPGFTIIHDVLHDALTSRVGVAKVWYETITEYEEDEYEGLSEEEADSILADETIVDGSIEIDPETGLMDLKLTLERKERQVKIEAIPPEEFLISRRAKCIKDASLVAHRTRKTKSALLAEGYPKDLVEKITVGEGGTPELDQDPEVVARFDQVDAVPTGDDGDQESAKVFMVYESYLNVDMDGSGRAKLWKVCHAGSVVLDKERVYCKPFVAYTPLRRPHSFWGSSYAAKVIPTQNARTVLTRSIIDHSLITNNPRLQVVRGGVTNPKELMENRIGGIVNVNRPDAILPVPQASLNPFVFQTVQMLDEDKEEVTGVSRLSQGLNKDAISKQNSADMVQDMVGASQRRQKIMARLFAETFLRDLYLLVYQIVLEEEDQDRIFEVAGSHISFDPASWRSRKDVTVEFTLGPGEEDAEAKKYLEVDVYMAQQPALAPMYPLEKRYNVLRKAMACRGIKDVDSYLLRPEQIQPPQPDPKAEAELKALNADTEMKLANARIAERKQAFAEEEARAKLALARSEAKAKHALEADRIDLDEAELAHKVKTDTAEIAILRQGPPAEVRGIASPTG